MTRALVLLAVVFAVASTLAIPAHKGAVKKPSVTCPPPTALAQRLKISGSAKDLNAFLCPVCLDIVDLGKDYIECGEEDTQKALDAQCETQNSFWLKQACLDIVNDVAKELEKETDEDIVDSAVCTKVLKADCKKH